MYNKQMLITLIAGLGLWGCETSSSLLGQGHGNAVRQNLAVQIINPDPQVDPAMADMSAERVELAHKRYREGKVIEPKTLKLRKSGSSGKSN